MRRSAVLLAAAALAAGVPAAADDTATVTATVVVQPIEVTLTVSPDSVAAGERGQARARITNHAGGPVRNVVSTLHLSEQVTVRQPRRRHVGALQGDATTEVRWQLCSDQPGAYLALVRVEAILGDDTNVSVESPARLLTVEETSGPPGPRCR